MSVLIDEDIAELALSDNLIDPFEPSCLQGASYDCRLGTQYVVSGRVLSLTDSEPTFRIEPGDFALLTSHERLRLPLQIIGHNGLGSFWAKRGLVTLFSPQIDPGFDGILYVPVFNAGDAALPITLHDKMFTVEFLTTTRPVSEGWSQRHGAQTRIQNLIVPAASRSNLTDISRLEAEVGQLRAATETLLRDVAVVKSSTSARDLANDAKMTALETRIDDWVGKRTVVVSRRNLYVAIIALVVSLISSPIAIIVWTAVSK